MPDVNEEIKSDAEFAIKVASERYMLVLDYSEQSIAGLERILEKIYWGFSGRSSSEGEGGLVYNTAIIWGSYLGEYMRLRWGGDWKIKDDHRVLLIKDKEFNPISLVFQKITGRINYKVSDYLYEAYGAIGPITRISQPRPSIQKISPDAYVATSGQVNSTQYRQSVNKDVIDRFRMLDASSRTDQGVKPDLDNTTDASKKDKASKKRNLWLSNRYLLYGVGIGGGIFVVIASIVVIISLSRGGLPVFGLLEPGTITSTHTPVVINLSTPTQTPTNSQTPTITLLPTYTPKPTSTPSPTSSPTETPSPTFTAEPSLTSTSTDTEIPYYPTDTYTRTPTPTPHHAQPSDTPTPTPVTPTKIPSPTFTDTPPPTILSCNVNPSTVNAGELTALTFTVQFSASGYGMNVVGFNPHFEGQSGCSDDNTDGDATASCQGNSGLLPYPQNVNVTISTPLGPCPIVSYHSIFP